MPGGKSFFIDTTCCIACRGCQVACKEWNQLAGEKTVNRGTPQNPEDFTCFTWKLVRFSEIDRGGLRWFFFSDQCRHCLEPPCKETADRKLKGLIELNEATGAVLAGTDISVSPAHFEEIRKACPYDIPRRDAERGTIAFCNMCIERVHAGLLPACVKTCPSGAMNFGERNAMLKLAERRLAEAGAAGQRAMLTDPAHTRVIYLLTGNPKDYHEFAVAAPGAFRPVE